MAAQPPDDGFHEIQLNGKQLVFLFMAATVVSVVIFLCGVLVGRGVRAERGGGTEAGGSPVAAVDLSPAATPAPSEAPSADADPTKASPPPAVEELSYFNRLGQQTPPADDLKPAPAQTAKAEPPAKAESKPEPKVEPKAEKPEPRAAKAAAPTPTPAPRAASAEPASSEPAGPGYIVQVAALNVRSEADAIAKRLASKGYAAYVLAPAAGTPSVFRVCIGKFPTRREADTVAAKLQKEEQFKPWVHR